MIEYVSDEVCVFVDKSKSEKEITSLFSIFDGQLKRNIDKGGFTVVSFPDSTNIFSVIDQLKSNPFIKSIEPNQICRPQFSPNDTHYSSGKQWALNNYGQNPPNGTSDADIDMPKAWDIIQGRSADLVAILDSGIPMIDGELSHEDLDDSNRFILGKDYSDEPDTSVTDNYGHGSHVLGIIGSETDNNVGIAGVILDGTFLINQVFDGQGGGDSPGFRYAVMHAVDQGAKVINFSGGFVESDTAIVSAISYAEDNDVIIVASTGNRINIYDPVSDIKYPAAYSELYDNVISVSATDHNDQFAILYAKADDSTNIYAPGGYGDSLNADDIYSTTPNYWFFLTTGADTMYGYMRGTSMATPHVAGMAALILSINPTLSPLQVKTIITSTVDSVYDDDYDVYLPRLNAYEALKYTVENYGGTIGGNGATVTFHEDITIESGVSLTIASGTTVKIAPDKKLTVKGTLSANNVTFRSTSINGEWSGFVFDGSTCSSSELYDCTIKEAVVGITITGSSASPTIEKCLVQDCDSYPLKLTSGCTPDIYDNKFYGDDAHAVYISSADGDFNDNEFRTSSGTTYGVYVTGTTSGPDFDAKEGETGNLFDLSEISSHGAYVASGHPEFGDSGPHDGLNDFINRGTSKYIYNNSGSTLNAEVNYRGGTPQSTWFSGSIDYTPYESSSNGAGPSWKLVVNPYASGIDLYERGLYEDALAELKTVLQQDSDSDKAASAAFKLAKSAYKLHKLDSEETFLNNLLNSSNSEVRHVCRSWLSYSYAMQGNLAKAEKVALEAPDSTLAQRAELLSLLSYYASREDESSMDRISMLLQEKHQDEYLAFDLHAAKESQHDFHKMLAKPKITIPKEFSLKNYPNPFNPVTTLEFKIPEKDHLKLQIFDILGREVKTLVDKEMEEGVHAIKWNGKNNHGQTAVSGLYFARLKTSSKVKTIKLLLVR